VEGERLASSRLRILLHGYQASVQLTKSNGLLVPIQQRPAATKEIVVSVGFIQERPMLVPPSRAALWIFIRRTTKTCNAV
jgi:hypothetical protein